MGMYDEKQMEECLAYFRARPVFGKLFQKMREKYAGLGHIGGRVVLTGLTRDEKAQLGGFLQKDYTEQKTVSVSAKHLEQCLAGSRFAGIEAKDLLYAWFDGDLRTRQGEKEETLKKREAYFASILQEGSDTPAGRWLADVLKEQGTGYALIMQQYRENPVRLADVLKKVTKASAFLPDPRSPELLAVFAAKMTGNPHYFDQGSVGEKILSAFLSARFPQEEKAGLTGAERKNRLFYQAGILRDNLSNEILCYGIRAWRQDGVLHKGVEGFFQEREPVHLTLRTLGGLGRAGAAVKEIFVVENPAVFSAVVSRNPSCAAVCVNGQPRLSALVLLDLLREEHGFLYAGDFDPEGLLIAQRLKERYGQSLQLWHYETEWYYRYLSEVELEDRRLQKLEKIWLPQLQGLKACMKKEKKAAYQEAMLELYCR